MKNLLIILDTNVYIHTFGASKKPSCIAFLDLLARSHPKYKIRIPRMIMEEVKRNLVPEIFREFMGFISELTSVDEDSVITFELGVKYETKGLKPADALIAAYAEWTGAAALITENRHFLTRRADLPFKVLTAEKALQLL